MNWRARACNRSRDSDTGCAAHRLRQDWRFAGARPPRFNPPQNYDLAAFAPSRLHLFRNEWRALPCRPLASACFEHSIDMAVRGLSFVSCAKTAVVEIASAAVPARRMTIFMTLSPLSPAVSQMFVSTKPRRQLPPEAREPWVHEREWGMNGEVSASVAVCQRYWYLKTWIMAGPRMTTNSTGKKNIIIGTVSFGGSAAAFFSASDMRMSRFSRAITRKAWPTGVP